MRRSTIVLAAAAGFLTIRGTACSDNTTTPAVDFDVTQLNVALFENGTQWRDSVTVVVTSNGSAAPQARMHYTVTNGSIANPSNTSDQNGIASVVLVAEQSDRAAGAPQVVICANPDASGGVCDHALTYTMAERPRPALSSSGR